MQGTRLRIGSDDFKDYRDTEGYVVDKSLFIREVIDGSKVLLFPRPRRFGKTFNMTMLRYFFEKSEEDQRYLYEDLAIAQSAEHMAHFGKYPTVYLTLKDLKADDWESARDKLSRQMAWLYRSFDYVRESLPAGVRERFVALCEERGDDASLQLSLKELIQHLYAYHGVPVVVLIDEYDTPLINAFYRSRQTPREEVGFYEQMVAFMRSWLGGALKHSEGQALFKGVVTGILRVAKESIFSDLNNLFVWSTLKTGKFADKFGFTDEEVRKVLADFGSEPLLPEFREWYNGYVFGDTVIYNPWSVLSSLAMLPSPLGPQWVNTSANTLVHTELEHGGLELKRDLETLLAGGELRYPINENIVFSEVGQNRENIWSFLYFSGYLRAEDPQPNPLKRTELRWQLSIPNVELATVYEAFVRRWHSQLHFGALEELLTALLAARFDEVECRLRQLVQGLVSMHDVSRYPEAFYHAFLLGLLANARSVYEIRSNAEAGYGRADLILRPKTADYPLAFILELKSVATDETMEAAAADALRQIDARGYEAQLLEAGVPQDNIHKAAVVFRGREVLVVPGG
jgi:hypothetical protein